MFAFLSFSSAFCLCFGSSISWLGPDVGGDDHGIEALGNSRVCQCVACFLIVDDLVSIFWICPGQVLINGIDGILIGMEPTFVIDKSHLVGIITLFLIIFPIFFFFLFLVVEYIGIIVFGDVVEEVGRKTLLE